MKIYAFTVAIAILSLTSCSHHIYSESELRSRLAGSWDTSTSFETNTATTHIVLKSIGKATFEEDGTVISETDSLMKIDVPEGQLPVEYRAVVHGKWSIDGQTLHTSRTSEEITAKNEISRKFIESNGMKKLCSESATTFVYALNVYSRKIVAVDSYGSRTVYTRKK